MIKEKNILILEDELPSLNFMKAIVKEICTAEYKVYACSNRREACNFMKEHKMALFLVDIMLEDGKFGKDSGYEFIKQIRKQKEYQFTPVIFVTGMEEPREGAYKDLHCYGYIQKPFSVLEIQRMIKQCLSFPAKENSQKLRLKKEGIYLLIEQSDVVYIKATRGHMYLKMKDGSQMEFPYMPLTDVMKDITEEEMLVCGKGEAVNKRYIDYMDVKEKKVYLRDKLGTIKLSKSYITSFVHSTTDINTQ